MIGVIDFVPPVELISYSLPVFVPGFYSFLLRYSNTPENTTVTSSMCNQVIPLLRYSLSSALTSSTKTLTRTSQDRPTLFTTHVTEDPSGNDE